MVGRFHTLAFSIELYFCDKKHLVGRFDKSSYWRHVRNICISVISLYFQLWFPTITARGSSFQMLTVDKYADTLMYGSITVLSSIHFSKSLVILYKNDTRLVGHKVWALLLRKFWIGTAYHRSSEFYIFSWNVWDSAYPTDLRISKLCRFRMPWKSLLP